jgi:hypothetical protein
MRLGPGDSPRGARVGTCSFNGDTYRTKEGQPDSARPGSRCNTSLRREREANDDGEARSAEA